MKNIFKENVDWGLNTRFYIFFIPLIIILIFLAFIFGYNGFADSELGGGILLYCLGVFSLFYIPIFVFLLRKSLISVFYIFFAYGLFFGFINGHILGVFSVNIFTIIIAMFVLVCWLFSNSNQKRNMGTLTFVWVLLAAIGFIVSPLEKKINTSIYQTKQKAYDEAYTKEVQKSESERAALPSEINITMDLAMANLTGKPGEIVNVTGTIQNFSRDTVYINSIGGSLGSNDLDFERTDFNTVVPHSYKAGELYKGPLFGISIDKNIKPGTYPVNFYIIGGKNSGDSQELTNQNLQITIK